MKRKKTIPVIFSTFLCVLTGIIYSQPVNDDCINAINLPNLTNFCSAPGAYTSVGATSSINPAQSCWGGTIGNDVWFKFVAIASDVNVVINGNVSGNGTLNRPKATIVWGTCTGTLNEFGACATAPVGQNTVTVYKSPLTIGQTYYIRVTGNNTNTGTFQLCINNFAAQPSPGADCGSKNYLCNKDPVTITKVTGAGTDNKEAAGTCMDASPPNPIEGNTAWYYWTAGSNGTLTFTLTPTNPADDIDWVLFDLPNGSCTNKQWLRCCAAGDLNGLPSPCLGPTGLNMTSTDMSEPINCPPTNDNFVRYLDMVQGKTYGLLIENFSAANNGFSLSFGGSGSFLGPTAIFTATDTTICAGTNVVFTNASQNAISYAWDFSSGGSPTSAATAGPHTVNYATPGTYTVTLSVTAQGGCPASKKMTVIVSPYPVITTVNGAICTGGSTQLTASGGNTYTWSPSTGLSATTGATVTASPTGTTTYTIVGTTNGCSGSTTVVVTVNPNPIVTVPAATICAGASTSLTASGASTYIWSPATGLSATTGTTVTANPAGTITYTVIGTTSGCTGSTAVVVTVQSCGFTVSATGNTVCNGVCGSVTSTVNGGTSPHTYLWNTGETTPNMTPIPCPTVTTTYTIIVTDSNVPAASASAIAVINVNPNPAVSVNAATICEGSSATLTASGATTYTWSPTTGLSSATGITVTASPNITSTYTITGSDPNGCTATATTVVTVNPIPVVTVPNASICPGGSTPLTASGAATYTWSPTTGLSSGVGTTVTANPSATTVYTVIGTSSGCTASTTVTVTVGALVATISPNVSICFGGSANLTAAGGSSYSWTPTTGLSNPTIFNPVASPTVTTTYTVMVSDVSCSDDAVVIVTVNPALTLNTAPVNATCFGACNGQTIVIPSGGNGSYSYNWSGSCNAAACSNVCAGTYTITVTDGLGCTASGVVTVTEPPVFTISATGGNACPGDSISLSASGAVSYSWSPSTGLSATTGTSVISTPSATTNYVITGTNASGCTATTTATATVIPNPIAAFTTSPQPTDIFNPTIYFNDNSTGAIIWNWKFGDSLNTFSSLQNPTFTYPAISKTYLIQLIVINSFGCIDSTTETVYIRGIFTFYIPNTFTPNNDGINDLFMAKGTGVDETDYHLWVFDRWGNLIWQTEIWGEAWNGKANGGANVAQIDTYVWKVHVKEKENGAKHNYIGHVNIVK